VNAWLEKFLKDALGIADGSKHRFLVGHNVISGQSITGPMKLCLGWLHFVQSDLRRLRRWSVPGPLKSPDGITSAQPLQRFDDQPTQWRPPRFVPGGPIRFPNTDFGLAQDADTGIRRFGFLLTLHVGGDHFCRSASLSDWRSTQSANFRYSAAIASSALLASLVDERAACSRHRSSSERYDAFWR
jgi:hypothetical protein